MNYSNVVPNKNVKDQCEWNNQGWMYRGKLFSRAWCSRARGDGCKLKEGSPKLYIKKKIFTVRLMRHWHRFPREVVDVPTLETCKISSWCTRSCPCSLQGCRTGWLLEVPSHPTQTIPWYTEKPPICTHFISCHPMCWPHTLWCGWMLVLLFAQHFHHHVQVLAAGIARVPLVSLESFAFL